MIEEREYIEYKVPKQSSKAGTREGGKKRYIKGGRRGAHADYSGNMLAKPMLPAFAQRRASAMIWSRRRRRDGASPVNMMLCRCFQRSQAPRSNKEERSFREGGGARGKAPILENVIPLWWPRCAAAPGKELIQELSREGAANKKVVHALGLLVTEKVEGSVREAMPG